jgi:hypothetical protein
MTETAPSVSPPPALTEDANRARSPHWVKLALTILLAAAIVAAAGLSQSGAGRHLVTKIGLAAPSQGYTALAFTHPIQVGRTGQYGPARVPVSFTITNRRHAVTTYHWQITVQQKVSAGGAVQVKPGTTAQVQSRVRVKCRVPPPATKRHPHPRVKPTRKQIRVALVGRVEAISFWEQCVG